MNITYRVDKDILYIALEGRIDASNAAAAENAFLPSVMKTRASMSSSTQTHWNTSLPPVCA